MAGKGNRQAFALGMTMPQLIDPERFNPAVTLWTGDAPAGERLEDYVAEDVKHEPHHGETPIGVSDEAVEASLKALDAAQSAAPFVSKDKAEYERIVKALPYSLTPSQRGRWRTCLATRPERRSRRAAGRCR